MSTEAQFTVSFNYALTNAERIEMSKLYIRAFGAVVTYEGTPPGGDDIHIMLKICNIEILIGPGKAVGRGLKDPIACEVRFKDEREFMNAYNALSEEGRECSLEGPYPWADKLGLIEDKFGVGWALYYNE